MFSSDGVSNIDDNIIMRGNKGEEEHKTIIIKIKMKSKCSKSVRDPTKIAIRKKNLNVSNTRTREELF